MVYITFIIYRMLQSVEPVLLQDAMFLVRNEFSNTIANIIILRNLPFQKQTLLEETVKILSYQILFH